jgi:hypothetical protein
MPSLARALRGRALRIFLFAALALPGPAAAEPSCRKLDNQIAHYQDVTRMAQARGDALWEESTAAHVSRLQDRRQRICPKPVGVVDQLGQMVSSAADLAVKYLTFQGF